MTDDRSRILQLLADGKITPGEAERLLDALAARTGTGAAPQSHTDDTEPTDEPKAPPKFLFVKILAANGDNVDVKIPLQLMRSGLKLTSLIPPQAMDHAGDTAGDELGHPDRDDDDQGNHQHRRQRQGAGSLGQVRLDRGQQPLALGMEGLEIGRAHV